MSTTGLKVFDKTIQETNLFLKVVMRELGTDDRHLAYGALRGTLHALRDRLPPESAVHLAAQLPMFVRGLFYDGWHPASTPSRERHQDEFLSHVSAMLPPSLQASPERAARAAFASLVECMECGEIAKIMRQLPGELRELWPVEIAEDIAS